MVWGKEFPAMSALPAPAVTYPWPGDVWDFAVRHKADVYLNPLLAATRRLFPTARSLRVFLEQDRELHEVWFIVFEVEVAQKDIPNYVEAQHRWTDELDRIEPYPHSCLVVLTLIPVAS
jgi:hypothetical protein